MAPSAQTRSTNAKKPTANGNNASHEEDECPFNAARDLPRTPPQGTAEPTGAKKHRPIILGTPMTPPKKESNRNAKANMEAFLNELSPIPQPHFGTHARNLTIKIEEYISDAIQRIQDMQEKAQDDGKKTTVTIQRRDIDAIKQNLIQAKEAMKEQADKQQQQQHQQDDTSDLECRTNTMESDIREIKEAIKTMMNTKAKTWAEVAAGGIRDNTRAENEMARKERLERARAMKAKAEIMLTFQDAAEDTKKSLQENTDQQVQKAITNHLHNKTDLKTIQLRGIQRPTKLTVKLLCRNEEDAQKLSKINWKELGGARMLKTTYGVVIHGIAKSDINPDTQKQEEIKDIMEELNNIKVIKVATLTKRIKNAEAPTHSIVILTNSPEEANNIINDGLKTQDGRIHEAKRYIPQCQIKQCYKCQGYGHRAMVCTRPAKCGKCAGEHETRQCSSEEHKQQCAQCKGEHPAWHNECPERQKEQQRLKALKDTIPPYFPMTI